MPNRAPLVSVCIPTYLGAKYLPMTIDSVLQQTFTDFELVIIDNASPDETPEVVARYNDPRIRYLRNKSNLGAERNWNRCIEEARGRYFKLLPTDDLIYPDTLERQVRILEDDAEGRLALVFGPRDIINGRGRPIARRGRLQGREGRVQGNDLVRRCITSGTNVIGEPGAVLLRKDLADAAGFFDASIPYVIDLDYWVRLLVRGDAYYMANSVAAFRVSAGSWSVALGAKQSQEYCRFIERMREHAGLGITAREALVGRFMAKANNVLRLLFYRALSLRGQAS